MPLWLATTALLMLAQGDSADQPEEIVITAHARKCDLSLDGRILSDNEFNSHAATWAAGSKPVRVRARADSDLQCLSRIAFRLADKGVKLIEFVDPQGRPAKPLTGSSGLVGGAAGGSDSAADPIRDREWRFLEARAAKLILDGQCAEARTLLLEAGDLDGAASAVAVCRAP